MKVLFVHQRLGGFGGAEANIFMTANELRLRGHEIGLAYRIGTGHNELEWHETFPLAERVSSCQELEDLLATFAPEVIYLHSLTDIEMVQSLVDSGIPTVKMVHDHSLYCLRSYKYNYFTRKPCTRAASWRCVVPCLGVVARNTDGWLPVKLQSYFRKQKELRLNRRCARHIVYSEHSRQELIRNGFEPSRIHIHVPIPCWGENGPVSSFDSRNLILFAGQIIRGKGVDVLLRALKQVEEPFECLILGEGNHRRKCEKLAGELGLNDRVRFTGYMPPDEMRGFYLEATCFTMSSVWPEPFGMAGPEAMRYGLPVVAFDAGGIREWLVDGENGFLVPWMDTARYARRIELLLRDKQLARAMGEKGRQRVNRIYDAPRQVDNLERILFGVARRQIRNRVPSGQFLTASVEL